MIPVSGFGRTLTLDVTSLAVSTVPPPALPMFASGLLALGLFGFVARKKLAPNNSGLLRSFS
jgi:hypothetical protein